MKPSILILAALAAVSFAGGAEARSIDCARAATRLDKTICGDPVLLDYDERIAAAYGRALAMWGGAIAPYVRRDQQQWLTAFRTIETLESEIDGDCVITDLACIRAEMRRRVDEVESGAYVHSGVYRTASGLKLLLHPGLANGYRVRVYDPAHLPNANLITADVDRAGLWDGPQVMLSKMGDGNGLPLPVSDGCTLRMMPEALAIRVVQSGACGGRNYAGTYTRLLDENLRSYELELF